MPHALDHLEEEGTQCRHFLLHSKWVHGGLFVLLLIDGLICLTCGVLEANYLAGKSDDCMAYVDHCTNASVGHRRLRIASLFEEFLLVDFGLEGTAAARLLGGVSDKSVKDVDCEVHEFGDHSLHEAEVALTYVSIGILCVFLMEQVALIVTLRAEYLRPTFITDFLVITSSLIIEIAVTNMTVVGLLVLARTWRFARVGHGVMVSAEKVEVLGEREKSIYSIGDVFRRLPDARWKEIKKLNGFTQDELRSHMTEEELSMVEELEKSPAVMIEGLALARAHLKMWRKGKKENQKAELAQMLLKGESSVESTVKGVSEENQQEHDGASSPGMPGQILENSSEDPLRNNKASPEQTGVGHQNFEAFDASKFGCLEGADEISKGPDSSAVESQLRMSAVADANVSPIVGMN